jgi:RNA polymerase sigma-70 factor, ECF subfamily
MDTGPLPDELEECMRTARAGSAEARGRLLEACRAYLLHVAGAELDARLRAKAGASDLVQDTFLEAHRIFERFEGASLPELQAWLRAILGNKLATFARAFQGTDKRRLEREAFLAGDHAGSQSTPSVIAGREEEEARLARALERLPEHYRTVIRWRQWDGLSFDEIARRLGRGVDAARMVWWRAVERLQRELGERE